MKILYSWLNEEYFDSKLPSAEIVADALMFNSFEIESIEKVGNDTVIDADVLPNRAHDSLSHRGIAKELSVILGIPFSEKVIEPNYSSVDSNLKVEVRQKDVCDRYMGRVLKNIEVKESPDWMKNRLEALGQRPINALVDATNYVLLDIGQPTHVFDLDKLHSEKIIIRDASDGETVKTLDGNKVELQNDNLVVADSESVLAIAGVKGGKKAEVTKETKNIVLESAHFDPVSVRKTSRKIGIMTDSSKRFENNPTPELAIEAMEYLTRLIVKLCGTQDTIVEHSVEWHQEKEHKESISVETEYINKLLGTSISESEVADIFNRFGWDYKKTGDEFEVNVPPERLDLENGADLVEEIGRVYGYKNIPLQELPEIEASYVNKEFYYISSIKRVLVNAGFSEVYTQSFQAKGKLKMANPVAQDRPYLREKIDPSEIFEKNFRNKDLLGLEEVKIFEIGNIFSKDAVEKLVLSIRSEKELDNNLLKNFNISVSGKEAHIELKGIIEKLPEVSSFKGLELAGTDAVQYGPFSQYPFVVRDIAVWLPESVEPSELVDTIKDNAGNLLIREPRLVDEYKKDGRISYAYRLVFQSPDKTLTDEEVLENMKNVEAAISRKNWEVR